MTTPPRLPRRGLMAGLRSSFLTGLVIVAPAVLTIWLITMMIDFVDARVLPLIPEAVIAQYLPDWLAGWTLSDVPGLGVIIFLVFTLLVAISDAA